MIPRPSKPFIRPGRTSKCAQPSSSEDDPRGAAPVELQGQTVRRGAVAIPAPPRPGHRGGAGVGARSEHQLLRWEVGGRLTPRGPIMKRFLSISESSRVRNYLQDFLFVNKTAPPPHTHPLAISETKGILEATQKSLRLPRRITRWE